MKLINSWRFAVKCMKLSYNLKINILCMGFLFIMALVYEVFYVTAGLGAFLLLIIATYPAQLIYSVCSSELVQSSPYRRSLMTSLPTVLTLCSGMAVYLVIICAEAVRAYVAPEKAGNGSRTVLLCGIMLMLLNMYMGLAYKYFVLSWVILAVSMMGYYYLSGLIGKGTALSQNLFNIPMLISVILGLCFTLAGNALQYGLSMLVYKKSMSRFAIFGLLRQRA